MKITKVKENREFRRAYNKAKSYVTPFIVVYIIKNRSLGVRLGITAGKKIGKAVCRNRAKRVITAAFRQCLPNISGNFDFIIVARSRILTAKSTVIADSLFKVLKTAGILKKGENDE